jgi:hypothetical protein
MEKSWVISVRNQCRRAKVPFFFKQWGGVRKSETGRTLDGKTFDELPKRRPVVASQTIAPPLDPAPAVSLSAVFS